MINNIFTEVRITTKLMTESNKKFTYQLVLLEMHSRYHPLSITFSTTVFFFFLLLKKIPYADNTFRENYTFASLFVLFYNFFLIRWSLCPLCTSICTFVKSFYKVLHKGKIYYRPPIMTNNNYAYGKIENPQEEKMQKLCFVMVPEVSLV